MTKGSSTTTNRAELPEDPLLLQIEQWTAIRFCSPLQRATGDLLRRLLCSSIKQGESADHPDFNFNDVSRGFDVDVFHERISAHKSSGNRGDLLCTQIEQWTAKRCSSPLLRVDLCEGPLFDTRAGDLQIEQTKKWVFCSRSTNRATELQGNNSVFYEWISARDHSSSLEQEIYKSSRPKNGSSVRDLQIEHGGSQGLPCLYDSSNGEPRGLSTYKLEVIDVSTSSSPLLGVFRGFDVKGVGLHLFVLGAGHQQHPQEGSFPRGKAVLGQGREVSPTWPPFDSSSSLRSVGRHRISSAQGLRS